jgi:peroxiredoxin
MPATFAISREGRVLYAHTSPDFRMRAEPADVLATLR